MTFAKGAALKDPAHLFNSSLDGNVRRAIDIHEGEKINVTALKYSGQPGGYPVRPPSTAWNRATSS
jgi:hypothetical protein